ncbi:MULTISPECIES: hypothetical protein [Xanthomonas translucens group]|nr:hypothetical protein [Xanthomonas translucens]
MKNSDARTTDLTDKPQRTTFQYPNASYDLCTPGRTIMLGIRGSF